MQSVSDLINTVILGNTIENYLVALALFIAGSFTLRIIKSVVVRRLSLHFQKHQNKVGEFFLKLFQETIFPVLYFGAFYFAINNLNLSRGLDRLVTSLWVILLAIQTARFVLGVSLVLIEETWFKDGSRHRLTISKSILTFVRVGIWGLASVFILDNLGFNVSAIVAGLGIGGIAAALAAQTILGDLFNYFVIFFDRPFEEGDTIIIGDDVGTIEHIGIKSTRIRALGGEQLVVSNSNLTSSRIRNYKRMSERRVIFKLGVTYKTPNEKLRNIPEMIKKIISGHKTTRVDRIHFKEFADSSLIIEVVYYVKGPDYNEFMDIHQEINLKIKETFEQEGIEFAYPTQTVYEHIESVPGRD